MVLGGVLSLLATVASIGLLSLSGWFIAATAYAGLNVATAKAFNFFLPSIGVRLFAMLRTGARYAERVISHDATFRILETLRIGTYERIEPLAPAPLEQHHSGDLLTRIITDIDTLDNLYLRVLSPSAVAAVATVLLLVFIGTFHPLIAAYSGCLIVVAAVCMPLIADRAARSSARRLNVQIARLRSTLVDGIHGLAALLTCDAQTGYLEKVHQRHSALIRSQEIMSHVAGFSNAAMGLLGGFAVAGALYIGVGAVESGTLSGPELVLLVLAVMAGFEVVAPLPTAYQYLGQTRKAAGRLRDITEVPPMVTFPSGAAQKPLDASVEFDKVSFTYALSDQPALKHVSFTIAPGHHTAIMGATGSGKSTIFYLLSRFEDPDTGGIRLGRCPLGALSEATLRKNICIVDQKAHIFNGTLQDNLRLTDTALEEADLLEALAAVQLADFAAHLPSGLQTWVGNDGRTLSGGQARRLAIARAVLSKAPIWALDEPTEGLDSATAETMMTHLINRGEDRTIIMITHRPEAIAQMDQVILMKNGRVAAVDSPDHLQRQSALFRRLISKNHYRS
jgi:ATP-binding cassette subfamily C protein CydC